MTTHTITAIFDDAVEVEAARQRLTQLGILSADVRSTDDDMSHADGLDPHQGLWDSIKDFFIDDGDHATPEGVRRGEFLLTAQVDEALTDDAIRVLDDSGAIDIGERPQGRQAEGWTATRSSRMAPNDAAGSESVSTNFTTGSESANDQEHRAPIVEEHLDRGSVRVRSYVVEEPRHVVVKKFAGERTQGVDETERLTDVDVDDSRRDSTTRDQEEGLDSSRESRRGPHVPR